MSFLTRKILIVELFDHSEVIFNLCKLLDQDGRFQTKVICQSYIIEGAHYHVFERTVFMPLSGRGTLQEQLAEHKHAEFQNADLVVWVTLPLFCRWIYKDYRDFNYVLILHNLRSWINPFPFLDWGAAHSFMFWGRLTRQWLFRKYQKAMLKSSSAILVLGEKLKVYLDKSSSMGVSQKALFLPVVKHAFASGHAAVPKDSFLQIAIPGAIIPNKGYEQIIQALEMLLPTLRQRLRIVLLGKVYSHTLLERFIALESKALTFQYYDQWIPPREFNSQIIKSQFLILPYGGTVKYGIVREKWGVTKASGALRDALLFNKPALISSNYSYPPANCVVYENSSSLANYLSFWLNNGVPRLPINDSSGAGRCFNDRLFEIALRGRLDY